MQFIGSYFPDRKFEAASQIGNFVIIEYNALMGAQPGWDSKAVECIKRTDLKIIISPAAVSEQYMLDPASIRQHLTYMRDGLQRAGVLDRVIGFVPSEEWFGGLKGIPSRLEDWQVYKAAKVSLQKLEPLHAYQIVADALRDVLNRYALLVKEIFPGVLVGHIEPWWSNNRQDGWDYAPIPPAYDFIGIDAYMWPAVNDGQWHGRVLAAYRRASEAGKPILAIAQVFKDPDGIWTELPSAGYIDKWWDLPKQFPLVQALAYFALEHPASYVPGASSRSLGMLDSPAHFEKAKQKWARRG